MALHTGTYDEEASAFYDACQAMGWRSRFQDQIIEMQREEGKERRVAEASFFRRLLEGSPGNDYADAPDGTMGHKAVLLKLMEILESTTRVAFLVDTKRAPDLMVRPLAANGNVRSTREAIELIQCQLSTVQRVLLERSGRPSPDAIPQNTNTGQDEGP